MVSMGEHLYAVKTNAIYAIQMADQIDPGRTNIAVPNTQQRILGLGSASSEVGRTFLTANALLRAQYLGKKFNETKALSTAFSYLLDVASMIEMRASLDAATSEATNDLKGVDPKTRALRLPAMGNPVQRFHAFTQKVGHSVDTLKCIARLFYPNDLSKKWIDSLLAMSETKYGAESPLTKFLRDARPTLLFFRDLRNMIEHPKDDAHLEIHDFRLSPALELIPPSVKIVKSGVNEDSTPMTTMMAEVTQSLVATFETFVAVLCQANVQSLAGFKVLVVELTDDHRRADNPHQRFSYGIEMNGGVQSLG